ncbi:MAG TPA: hypothetical protein PLM53_16215 [Spirochaetota bacterium]|nr:hypothetical protein [Spirochaetota bacterium]HQF10047.1 hypothetical protein [Spirochaetota bacterium]HQH98642.1 hypothetical protein [Spirochaetota bacterium]HQJ72119.1 hypothetical protein [Spirochaetota bacterium]
MGLGNHERPWLSCGSTELLEDNIFISIEPALYFGEIGGFRHSDTVLVTKDGYENLTKYPSDLIHLVIHGSPIAKKIKGAITMEAVHFN